jgi:hypothetical protein
LTRIIEAVQLGQAGAPAQARELLTALWDEIGPAGDALHRCTLAHYLADCHRRLGNTGPAREYLAPAREHLAQLPDDPYGESIRAAVGDFVADDPTDRRRR